MTQDEIIRMAREAGLDHYLTVRDFPKQLERFAALVAAHEAKEHLEMLENLREKTKAHCLQGMAESYEMGRQEEREACAKVCDTWGINNYATQECAAEIRARSNNNGS